MLTFLWAFPTSSDFILDLPVASPMHKVLHSNTLVPCILCTEVQGTRIRLSWCEFVFLGCIHATGVSSACASHRWTSRVLKLSMSQK